MTREVPTGISTCARTATGFTCKQETKPEHYTVPAVRRVDRKRDADLRAQGLWFEDEEESEDLADDPLMSEFDEDEDDLGKPDKS